MTRRKCTKENPYTDTRDKAEPGSGWEHDAAYEIGDQEHRWPGGDIIQMRCGDCGTEWESELPQ